MSANNFRLSLDTAAPVNTITYPSSILQTNTTVRATFSADAGVNYMKVWADGTANTTEANAPQGTDWEVFASYKDFTFNNEGVYYIHAIFLDDVGNKSAVQHSPLIRYEHTAPTITSIYAYDTDSNSHDYVNNLALKLYTNIADNGTSGTISGLNRLEVSCTDFDSTFIFDSGIDGERTFDIAFASGTTAGDKTITVTAYDNAGNSSYQTCHIYYDAAIASATLTLKATAADSNSLIQYLKASNNSFVAIINTTDTDITHYQLYGDITINGTAATESWVAWPTAGATSATISDLAFTTVTDGTKTIHAKVKDAAGNIYTLTDVTRVYDNTIPDVTISAGASWIAAGNGSINSTAITYTCSDATSGLASGSPSFTCNGTTITGVTGGSFTFSASTAGAVTGSNTIVISATDNSGNTTTAQVIVNIESSFSIDSAVLGGYALEANYYNATTVLALTATINNSVPPTSGRSVLYLWTDTTENNEQIPLGLDSVPWNSDSQAVATGSIDKDYAEQNNNYFHVKAISSVGNVAYKHVQFSYDATAPSFNLTVNQAHAATETNTINILSGVDTGSGLYQYKIEAKTGTTVSSGLCSWTAYSSNLSPTIVLDNSISSGIYGVVVTLRDRAGNETPHEITWELDKDAPHGSVTLYDIDGITPKGNVSADNKFKIGIDFTTPDSTDTYQTVQYKIYGDFSTQNNGSATAEGNNDSGWQNLTANSIITDTYYCTGNVAGSPSDGVNKTINVKLKDDAGNITSLSAVFKYNPNQAGLVIQTPTHLRISCTHALRKEVTSGVVNDRDNDWADIVAFDVTSDQTIIEWKVAAYTTYPESTVAGDAVTAITQLTGSHSSGYSSGQIAGTQSFSVIVDGKDFRNALGGSDQVNVDGIHYIVVFAKNQAGVWTTAGTPAEL